MGQESKQFLLYSVLFGLLPGCRAQAPVVKSAPPATTLEACTQIREFFVKKYHVSSDAPADMNSGCHMRISANLRASSALDKELESHGWSRDPFFGTEVVPSEVAYETPTTRCTIVKLVDEATRDGRISGGFGIGGGSHVSTSFGLGLGVGTGTDSRITYKIDCLPRRTS